MRKLFLLVILLQATFVKAEEGIKFFSGTFEQALTEAKVQDKLLFIDCYTTWCGPCKWMVANVFSNDTIADYFNEHFVCYKLDMEKGEGPTVAKDYSVRNYPTFLWLNGAGKQQHRSVGANSVENFLVIADRATNPGGNMAFLEEQYKNANHRPEILLAYAYVLRDAYDMTYQTVADEFFQSMPLEGLADETTWKGVMTFTPNINSSVYRYMEANPDKFVERYGKDSVKHVMELLALQSVYYAAQQNDSLMMYDAVVKLRKSGNTERIKEGALAELNYYKRNKMMSRYTMIAPSYVDQYFWNDAHALNDVCWTYFMKVNDKVQIADAVKWIARSVSLEDKYYNTDTQANLLAKAGQKKEAIEAANHSIDVAKKNNEDYTETQALLEKLLKE